MQQTERPRGPLVHVAVALGSNVGDRRAHLDDALKALSRDLSDLKSSPFIETEPVGPVDVIAGQSAYLNAAAVGVTGLSPRDLLDRLMAIEEAQGRTRPHPLAARTLDLDLILYGSDVLEEPGLTVPHPRFREREFVLAPLAAVAPDMIDPISGMTVLQLLEALKAR